jgi:hypothetical protein
MALSKRLRFEILRRDGHACRYCGAKAPTVTITVDHVIPVTLGGTDSPTNLVAACPACNAGKSSSSADAPEVPDIRPDAIRWSRAMLAVGEDLANLIESKTDYLDGFHDEWSTWHFRDGGASVPLPTGWRHSIDRWRRLAVPLDVVIDATRDAMTYVHYRNDDEDKEFRFMAGIVWKHVDQMHLRAQDRLTEWPDGPYGLADAHQKGWTEGHDVGYGIGLSEGQKWITPSVKQAMHTYVHLSRVVDGDLSKIGVTP